MRQRRVAIGDFGLGRLRQLLAQFHPPLVEAVDPPDRALHEHAVLVQRHQRAERGRVQAIGEQRAAGPVALEAPPRRQVRVLPAEGQRLALREQVGHQQVVLRAVPPQRTAEADEVAGHQPRALVQQLVERVLAVGAGLAPVHRAGRVVDRLAPGGDRLAVALHRQLLQVGREALEVVGVRQDRLGRRAEEVGVPDRDQAEQHRQVAGHRRGAEMHVHGVEAVQHGAELLRADRQHRRQPDRRVHRVTAADPVPEPEHVVRVDAELAHPAGIGGHRDEMPGHRGFAQRPDAPLAGRVRVGQGLLGGEGLGADDEQRLRRVEVAHRLAEVGRVHVGHEAQLEVAARVMAQGLAGHHRPEVGTADADVDDVADALAAGAGPAPVADPLAEAGHPRQHLLHLGHHVLAAGREAFARGRTQRHVQRRAVLGGVHVLAAEHRLAPLLQPAGVGQREQQPQRLVVDPLLGVVEVQPGAFGDQALAAPRVGIEQLAQAAPGMRLGVPLQRLPFRSPGQHHAQPPTLPALSSMRSSNWFQDFTNDSAPSSCNCRASASVSMPASA